MYLVWNQNPANPDVRKQVFEACDHVSTSTLCKVFLSLRIALPSAFDQGLGKTKDCAAMNVLQTSQDVADRRTC